MVFKKEEPGPRFAAMQAAELIADFGEDRAPVVNQLRRFAQRRHVLTRGQKGSGRTASNLFAVPDLAVAKVIRTLTGLGLADPEIAEAAAFACYLGGEVREENPNGHLITDALLACKPPNFPPDLVFQLDVSFQSDGGRRQMNATIFDASKQRQEYNPGRAASIRIPLRPWLPEIAALLKE